MNIHVVHVSSIITLFSVVEIFLDGIRYLKICYTNIIPRRGKISIAILLFGRWLMVVPSIKHGNGVPDTRVGGLFRARQSSPTAAAYCIYLCTNDIANNERNLLRYA